jgi:exopolyphosphatase/pppGpp-phosphohydrolase
MCSIAEDSHIQCEIPGFSYRNWKNVDYGVKFQEHFKKNNKDMSFDFSIAKKIANNQMYSIVWEKKSQKNATKD